MSSTVDTDWTPSNGAAEYLTMESSDQRIEILRRLGINEDRKTPMSKGALNSLMAYLTGKFAIQPYKLFMPDAPTKDQLMFRIARECDLKGWLTHYKEEVMDEDRRGREFNNNERARILAEMDERGDQREWAVGDFAELGEV